MIYATDAEAFKAIEEYELEDSHDVVYRHVNDDFVLREKEPGE